MRTCSVAALLLLAAAPLRAADGKPDAPPQILRGRLDPKDPPDRLLKQSPHKVHEVTLAAGQLYQVDLVSKDFDAFLRLEDAAGKNLAHDDDSGGGTNARLLFKPAAGGSYRVIVTAVPKGQPRGAYVLTVRLADESGQRVYQAQALEAAAAQHYRRGEPRAAEALLREALALRRRQEASNPSAEGQRSLSMNLNNLGVLLCGLGKRPEAREYLEQALAIRKKVLPPNHPELATTLYNLGRVLHDLGKLEEARRCYEQALAIDTQVLPPDHPKLASILNSLGGLLHGLHKGEEAQRCLEQAFAIWKKVLPPDHPDLAASLNNLGKLLHDLGKGSEARRCYEQALAIRKKVLPPDHPDLATSLNNLGRLLSNLGKQDEAREYLEQALAIRKKVLPPDHPDLALSLNSLGLLLHDLGQREEARGYYERALAIQQKVLPLDHPYLAATLNNLGMLLHSLGKREEARRCLEQVLAINTKVLPPDHPDLATSLGNLGGLAHALGKGQEARGYFERALEIQQKGLPPDHPSLAVSLHNLGVLLWHQGDRARAWPLLSQAVTAATTSARRLATASAQRDHADLLRGRRADLDILCSAAVQTGSLTPRQRQELLWAVLQARGISTAALTSGRDALLVQGNSAARSQLEALRGQQRRLADLLLRGPGAQAPGSYRADCLTLVKDIDERERKLARQVEGFALEQQTHNATPAQVAGRLPAGSVLVETIRYGSFRFPGAPAAEQWGPLRYAALLLWAGVKEPEIRLVDLGDAARLEVAIGAWRRAVQQGQADPRTAQTLRTRLWQPLARALPPNTQRLIVAPDGALALVPFEALQQADGKYLVESLQISYVSSGRDLMPRPLPRERPRHAHLLSNPDYDLPARPAEPAQPRSEVGNDSLRAGLRFRSLPGFAREASAIAKLLHDQAGWKVETLARGDASEEALARAARPRLLYCITHGFFLQDIERSPKTLGMRDLELVGGGVRPALPRFGADPRLRSGLALAGANQWQERSAKGLSDGLLTALEVENLDLWGTDLVVLSACETGLGEVQIGEGVLGLRRAFQLAGAQTVVASLWKVPDVETEQLMTSFLRRWLKGQGKADALRQAQLDMIRRLRASPSAARRSAPPLYWAGFICHGRAD